MVYHHSINIQDTTKICKVMDNIVKLNVGGTKFYTKISTLQKHPETRLGQLNFQSQEYIAEKHFFFFDRNPELFNIILDFYRNGSVHLPSGICSALMEIELEFWGIPFNNISECCRSNIVNANNELETIKNIKNVFGNYDTCDDINVVNSKWSYLHKLWLFLEEPVSSRPAKVIKYYPYLSTFLFTNCSQCYSWIILEEEFEDTKGVIRIASGSGKNTNIRQSMLKLATHSGFHDLFLKSFSPYFFFQLQSNVVGSVDTSVATKLTCNNSA